MENYVPVDVVNDTDGIYSRIESISISIQTSRRLWEDMWWVVMVLIVALEPEIKIIIQRQ